MVFFSNKNRRGSESVQDDYSLWQNLKNGSADSLKSLHYRYYNELYQYGLRITNNPAMAKEAIQDLFVYIWEKHSTLNTVKSIKPYIFKSFRNRLIKKRASKILYIDNLDNLEKTFFDFSIEDFIIGNENDKELKERVKNLLNKLSKNQKEVILLKFYHNLTYREIAELLNIEYQSVRNSVSRAFKILRKHIE